MLTRTLLIVLGSLAIGTIFGPVGAGIGAAIGLSIAAVWIAIEGLPQSGPAVIETHTERVLCVPHASIAECKMTRDATTGLWLNVEKCSLCEGEDKILCEKCCLVVMNDTARRPGRLLKDEAPAAA